jgi:hypothetical protein
VDDDLAAIQVLEALRATPQIWDRIPPGDSHAPSIQAALRKEFPAEVVRAALTLAGLRTQGRLRFERADQMWFDRTRLEQATQELVARHKAQRFARCSDQVVLDLCSGIGADAVAIAQQARVLAVDSSPLAAWYTRQNAAVYGVDERIETLVSPVESVEVSGRFVHLDPDRRTNGQRQVRLEFGSPPLEYLQSLTQTAAGGAIKVSPASNFGGKFAGCEIELVSVNGECKEATIWFGALRDPTPFRATVLPSGASIAGDPWDYRPRLAPLRKYLFDPDPAVVRAGLVDCLAESIGLFRTDDAEEYLTADEPVNSPFIRGFEVLADLSNHPTEIREYFRNSSFGQLEIKCRHIRIDADAVRRKLSLPGNEPGVLLFVRVAGKARAVVARRLPADV